MMTRGLNDGASMVAPRLSVDSVGASRAYVLDGTRTIDPDSDIEAIWWEWDLQGQSITSFKIMPLFLEANSTADCIPLAPERLAALSGLPSLPIAGGIYNGIRGCPGPLAPTSSDGKAIPAKIMGPVVAFVEAIVPGSK